MSVDPKHFAQATRRLKLAQADHRAGFLAYQARCREQVPQLADLDARIAGAVTRAVAAALRQGEDPTPAVEAARRDSLALQAQRREALVAAGIDPQTLEETPYCPHCGDTGRLPGGGLCSCLLSLCVAENRRELAAQLELDALTFDRFSLQWYSPAFDPDQGTSPRECMETVLQVCRDYAQRFPRHPFHNLFLYGGTGLGKTFLSGCIAGTVCAGGHWTVYVTAADLFRHYEAAKFSHSEDAGEAVDRFERCDLLVLDDLGSELTTQFVQSALYQLLNTRMLRGGRTVISSNLTMDDVRARYTPQAASRLEGEFRGLPFLGTDIRLQKKGG